MYGPFTLAATLKRLLRSYPVPHPVRPLTWAGEHLKTRALPVELRTTARASTTTDPSRCPTSAEAPRLQRITVHTADGLEHFTAR